MNRRVRKPLTLILLMALLSGHIHSGETCSNFLNKVNQIFINEIQDKLKGVLNQANDVLNNVNNQAQDFVNGLIGDGEREIKKLGNFFEDVHNEIHNVQFEVDKFLNKFNDPRQVQEIFGLMNELIIKPTLTKEATKLTRMLIDLLGRPVADVFTLPTHPCIRIKAEGFECEIHNVTTEDGYILEIHRLPFPGGKPVFIQHGLLSSSADWFLNEKHNSLPYILHEAGFDVYLGNVRGNTYSRKHVRYTTDDDVFWQFTFDQMGEKDLPAMVDKTLELSSASELTYVGYSQGSLIGFNNFGSNSKLDNKIKLFIALAPVRTMEHLDTILKYFAPFSQALGDALTIFGAHEFLSHNPLMEMLARACEISHVTQSLCSNGLFLLAGSDQKNLDLSRIATYLRYVPAGSSTRNLIHFAQAIGSNKMRKYDYGTAWKNELEYNQKTPPEYDLTKFITPTVLLYGGRDKLTTPKEVGTWYKELKSLENKLEIIDYDHLDFMWATNTMKLFKLVRNLIIYNNRNDNIGEAYLDLQAIFDHPEEFPVVTPSPDVTTTATDGTTPVTTTDVPVMDKSVGETVNEKEPVEETPVINFAEMVANWGNQQGFQEGRR